MEKRDRSGYLAEDTIAAIATAVGGPISMIRISGPRAFEALQIISKNSDYESPRGNELIHRYLKRTQLIDEQGLPLDDALTVQFLKPESFTGEDVVELHLHGSPYIATRILEILNQHGIRQSLPGEFSFRAVRNGKLSLAQAQAVADLIAAANQNAVSLALEKMAGSQNRLLGNLADSLRNLAVLGELGIDFADQDIEQLALPQLRNRLISIIDTLTLLKDTYDRGTRIQDGIKVSFLGLPNAGKSSFFNSILGEERSIVSEIPGTTRDLVREKITLRTKTQMVTLRIEDTAGLRASEDRIEIMGIERSQKSAAESDLVLYLVDSTTVFSSAMHESLVQWKKIHSPEAKAIGVLTKIDLLNAEQLSKLSHQIEPFQIQKWVTVSSHTGQGMSQAIQVIAEHCAQWTSRKQGEILLTRLDQVESISSAIESLARASKVEDLDLFAADIRQALHTLANLIGDTPADDILAKIFSDFCIGK